MPSVEKTYANALVDVSSEHNNLDSSLEDLRSVVCIYNENPEFKSFFQNPEVKPAIKKETLEKLFSGKVNTVILNFLMLLLDKGRFSYLPDIEKEFIRLSDIRKNILYMAIITPKPLEDSQISSIKEKYRSMYHASSVKADVEIDEKLIGGIIVKIGDRVFDASLRGRLESLKDLIVNS